MKFILNRDLVHASTTGHSVEFKKGVPTYVPPTVRKEVLAFGALPETGEDIIKETVENYVPSDPDERKQAIFDAFRTMIEAGTREFFTATGIPELTAVTKIVGWKVDQAERTRYWGEYQAEQNDGEGV